MLASKISEEIIDVPVRNLYEDRLSFILRDTPTPEKLEEESVESVVFEDELPKVQKITPLPSIAKLDNAIIRPVFKPLERMDSIAKDEYIEL